MRKNRAIVISIGGLLPASYQGDIFSPLYLLARQGAWASAAVPVYPSLTYSNHATLVTGATSDRHGILGQLHAFPDAICAVECVSGFSLGQNLEGPLVTRLDHIRGEHGYLPEVDGMDTGFFAIDPGITPGKPLGRIRLVDVAPTVAHCLGLEMTGTEGRILPLGPGYLNRMPERFTPARSQSSDTRSDAR